MYASCIQARKLFSFQTQHLDPSEIPVIQYLSDIVNTNSWECIQPHLISLSLTHTSKAISMQSVYLQTVYLDKNPQEIVHFYCTEGLSTV